jgi:hypothetical protein
MIMHIAKTDSIHPNTKPHPKLPRLTLSIETPRNIFTTN